MPEFWDKFKEQEDKEKHQKAMRDSIGLEGIDHRPERRERQSKINQILASAAEMRNSAKKRGRHRKDKNDG